MTEYITEIQRQLVDCYGYKRGANGYPENVPDGAYPMMIEKKLDLVVIVNGGIWCCNHIAEKSGLKTFQKEARGKYRHNDQGMASARCGLDQLETLSPSPSPPCSSSSE